MTGALGGLYDAILGMGGEPETCARGSVKSAQISVWDRNYVAANDVNVRFRPFCLTPAISIILKRSRHCYLHPTPITSISSITVISIGMSVGHGGRAMLGWAVTGRFMTKFVMVRVVVGQVLVGWLLVGAHQRGTDVLPRLLEGPLWPQGGHQRAS